MVQIEIRCFCPISPPWDILPVPSAFDPYRSVIVTIVLSMDSMDYGIWRMYVHVQSHITTYKHPHESPIQAARFRSRFGSRSNTRYLRFP